MVKILDFIDIKGLFLGIHDVRRNRNYFHIRTTVDVIGS